MEKVAVSGSVLRTFSATYIAFGYGQLIDTNNYCITVYVECIATFIPFRKWQ